MSTIEIDTRRAVFGRLLAAFELNQSSLISYRWARATQCVCNMKIEFNHFTAGYLTEGDSNIPAPSNSHRVWTVGHDKLSIQDDATTSSCWFAMQKILPNCAGDELISISDLYHEWGCSSNEPNARLGGIFPIVVAAPRQVVREN